MSGLFAAGLILLALAAAADLLGGRFLRTWPLYLAGAAGSACLAVLGGFAVGGRDVQLGVAGWLGNPVPGQQAAALDADRLSGMFLALTFGAAVPVSVALASWSSRTRSGRHRLGASYALTGAAVGGRRLVAAGLLAATLQVVAHTVAKSLLFTSSAGIEAATGRDDLEELRGRARQARWSGFGLAVGSVTLAGLPPTVGFVSEWFLLESLMQQFRVPGLGYRLVLALAGGAVALTVGFAGVTFVRLVGLIVLGRGTDSEPARSEYGWAGRAAVVVLALACLATAAITPLEIRVIAAGLSPVVSSSLTVGALKYPWILQPVYAGFSILSPSWLWVELPLMLLLTVLFAWVVSGRRLLRVRRVPAWRSATIGVGGVGSYTAFGYANPTRRVLAGVLHTRAELREVMMEDNLSDDGSGPPDRADPGQEEAAAHLRYASDFMEVVETYVHRPAHVFFMAIVTAAKRLQSGRLDAYLLYMLIALIAVIAVVTALA